jgi:hypothetical protein
VSVVIVENVFTFSELNLEEVKDGSEDVELEEDGLEEDELEVSELEEDKFEEDEVFFELEVSELEEDKLVAGELTSASLAYTKISDEYK